MADYTVKQLADKLNISAHTIRFYDDQGLFPDVMRDTNGTRIFNDSNLEWIYLVLCLRNTGMPVAEIRHYIKLCQEGEATVEERYQIIIRQREKAEQDLQEMRHRLEILDMKMKCYEDILTQKSGDVCNPAAKKR